MGDLPGFDPDLMVRFRAGPQIQGQLPLVRAGDPSHRKVKYRPLVHSRIFDLKDSEQMTDYQTLMQRAADGAIRIVDCEPPRAENEYQSFVMWAESMIMGGEG